MTVYTNKQNLCLFTKIIIWEMKLEYLKMKKKKKDQKLLFTVAGFVYISFGNISF